MYALQSLLWPSIRDGFRSTGSTIATFFMYCWWVIVLDMGLPILLGYTQRTELLTKGQVSSAVLLVHIITQFLIIAYLALAARPTSYKKNFAYFRQFCSGICLVVGLLLVFGIPTVYLAGDTLAAYLENALMPGIHSLFFVILLPLTLYAFSTTFMLYWADKNVKVESLLSSLLSSLKMLFYSFPFYILALLLYYGLLWGFAVLMLLLHMAYRLIDAPILIYPMIVSKWGLAHGMLLFKHYVLILFKIIVEVIFLSFLVSMIAQFYTKRRQH